MHSLVKKVRLPHALLTPPAVATLQINYFKQSMEIGIQVTEIEMGPKTDW